MNRLRACSLASLALLAVLPGCVAAIGNTGYGLGSYPKSTAPLLEERVEAARRIVELRQQHLDLLRKQQEAGRGEATAVIDAEIAVEEARLRLLQCRADLSAIRDRKDDE